MKRVVFAVLLGCASAPLVACQNEEPKSALGYTASAQKSYEAAMEEFKSRNWIEAQSLMRDVKRKYSYSKFAKLAELRIADADYEQEKYADAIRGYRQFIHDHRSEEDDVAYAKSRIAESEFQQIPDSFLLPAGEERDQASVMEAYKELSRFLQDYPKSKESAHMRDLLSQVTARLVKHELYVARFYLNKDNYEAAVSRILYALRTFATAGPDASGAPSATASSGLEPDALLLLGETYMRMHKWPDARESFLTILHKYPKSTLTTSARGYLYFMKQHGV